MQGQETPFAVLDPTSSVFASPGHPLRNGQQVRLVAEPGRSLPAGIHSDRPYEVRDVTSDTFRVAEIHDGPPVIMGSPGAGRAVLVADAPRRRWPWVVAAVVAVLAAAVLLLVLFTRSVTVPAVVDLASAQAQSKTEGAGLTFVVTGVRFTTEQKSGTVLTQYPDPGTKAKKGSQLSVVLATDAQQATVPDVLGKDLAAATQSLFAAGLAVSPPVQQDSDKPKGTVLKQDPAAGKTVQSGSSVTLTVSNGPAAAKVRVPNVIGTQEKTATAILDALGLTIKTSSVVSATTPDDVIAQSPAAGVTVDQGSTVELVVARAASTTTSSSTSTTASTTSTTAPPSTGTTLPPARLLYKADWSKGIAGWTGAPGWEVKNGSLVNDGLAEPTEGPPPAMVAPFAPPSPSYAVVAEMDNSAAPDGPSVASAGFGVVARLKDGNGYTVGVRRDPTSQSGALVVFVAAAAQGEVLNDHVLAEKPFTAKPGPHTYTVQLKDEAITVSVDSQLVLTVTDPRFTDAGTVGVWSQGCPVIVGSFAVYSIP